MDLKLTRELMARRYQAAGQPSAAAAMRDGFAFSDEEKRCSELMADTWAAALGPVEYTKCRCLYIESTVFIENYAKDGWAPWALMPQHADQVDIWFKRPRCP